MSLIDDLIEKWTEKSKSQWHLIVHWFEVPHYEFISDLETLKQSDKENYDLWYKDWHRDILNNIVDYWFKQSEKEVSKCKQCWCNISLPNFCSDCRENGID